MSETAHTPMASLAFMPLKAVQVIDGFNLIDAEGAHYGHISTGTNLDLSKAIINAANVHDDLVATLRRISEMSVPDQPASSELDEPDWVRRHVGEIRFIARAAIAKAEGRS